MSTPSGARLRGQDFELSCGPASARRAEALGARIGGGDSDRAVPGRVINLRCCPKVKLSGDVPIDDGRQHSSARSGRFTGLVRGGDFGDRTRRRTPRLAVRQEPFQLFCPVLHDHQSHRTVAGIWRSVRDHHQKPLIVGRDIVGSANVRLARRLPPEELSGCARSPCRPPLHSDPHHGAVWC